MDLQGNNERFVKCTAFGASSKCRKSWHFFVQDAHEIKEKWEKVKNTNETKEKGATVNTIYFLGGLLMRSVKSDKKTQKQGGTRKSKGAIVKFNLLFKKSKRLSSEKTLIFAQMPTF